jgi:phosphocarrier protein HPr
MKEKTVKINNHAGIHCRPASNILNAINEYPDHRFVIVFPSREDTELNSILSLIALGLQRGDSISLRVTGPQEEVACEKIAQLFETEFDFPPRV